MRRLLWIGAAAVSMMACEDLSSTSQVQPHVLVQPPSNPGPERSAPASSALDAYRQEMVRVVGVDGKRYEMRRWEAEKSLRKYPEAYTRIEPLTEGRSDLGALLTAPAESQAPPRRDETLRQLRATKRDDLARSPPPSAGSDPTVGDPFAR
jgi:hypothetical protein